jgi:hypothetical protein
LKDLAREAKANDVAFRKRVRTVLSGSYSALLQYRQRRARLCAGARPLPVGVCRSVSEGDSCLATS